MGRGNSLTDHVKGKIDAFEKDGAFSTRNRQENQQIKVCSE